MKPPATFSAAERVRIKASGEVATVISPLDLEFDNNGNLRVSYQIDNKGFVETYQDVELTRDPSETLPIGGSDLSEGESASPPTEREPAGTGGE